MTARSSPWRWCWTVAACPRRSRVFADNASEPATLKEMLSGLNAPPGATVVMDAGIATEANLTWLRAQGYHCVVVSRLRERQFDPALATEVQTAGDETIKIQRVIDEQGHALLYCHSPAREPRAIDAAKTAGFEAVLLKLQAGLTKPREAKDVATIMQRLGRAKQRYARAAQHYQVEITQDGPTWSQCSARSRPTWAGHPVFHRIDRRVEGHLFISVLAYHFVHMLRLQLKAQGIDDSWQTLRETLTTQRRVTATLQRRDCPRGACAQGQPT